MLTIKLHGKDAVSFDSNSSGVISFQDGKTIKCPISLIEHAIAHYFNGMSGVLDSSGNPVAYCPNQIHITQL